MNDYIEKNEGYITNSKMNVFVFCPTLYNLKFNKKIVPDITSDALMFGSAFDLYIQDVSEVEKEYIIVDKRFDPKIKLDKIKTSMQKIEEELSNFLKSNSLELEKPKKTDLKKFETNKIKIEKLKQEKKEIEQTLHKKQLTPMMGRKLRQCLKEFERQPLFRFNNKNAQVSVVIDYKGHKLRGTMDEFDKKKELISDVKTAASIDGLDRYFLSEKTTLEKYKNQLSFYQLLVQIKFDILCDGELKIVTKETPERSQFYFAGRKSLLDNRGSLFTVLDQMIDTIGLGIYPSSPRHKCLRCPGYGVCEYAKQQEYILI